MSLGAIKRFATATLIASAVVFASPVAAQDGENLEIPLAQASAIAQNALRDNRPDVAFAIAQAMLRRDPDDPEAHLIMAILARGAGDLDLADEAATLAWRNAETDQQRFDAAFLAADVAARQERLTSAQIWLRRADQNAPNEIAEQSVAQAYRGVSARKPLSVRLSFSVLPSNNLNNGSPPDTVFIVGPFPFSLENAVPGTEASLGGSLSYRLSESARHRTEFLVQTYIRRAIIASEDIEAFNAGTSNDITRHEFDYGVLSFGISHRQAVFDGLGPTGVRVNYGASYYRNDHLASFGELALTQDVPVDDDTFLRYGLTLRDETRFDSDAASYVSQAASLDWFRQAEGGPAYGIGATFTYFNSAGATTKGRQLAARARVVFAEPILGAKADLGLNLTLRDLPEFSGGTGRRDLTSRAVFGLNFEDLSFYGFQPRVEFVRTETNSDLDQWDRRRSYSVGTTFVSRF